MSGEGKETDLHGVECGHMCDNPENVLVSVNFYFREN